MRSGRPSRTRVRRIRHLIRLLTSLVLTVFLSQCTLAFAFPCVAWDRAGTDEPCPCDEDEGDDQDQEHHCPCPIQCAGCCAGSSVQTVAPSPPDLDVPLPLGTELLWIRADRAPPRTEPAEVPHVPKVIA